LYYFADVEDHVAGELGGGEEFENGCCCQYMPSKI
jgi:hypothetical protein